MEDDRPVSVAFDRIAALALATGAQSIKDLPGLWEHELADGIWKVAVNGHSETVERVPPYSAMVWFNGWPAGCLGPYDGCLAMGSEANEDALIAALEAEIGRVESGIVPSVGRV